MVDGYIWYNMGMIEKPIRNQAFIDGQNLEFSTTNADKAWKVDYYTTLNDDCVHKKIELNGWKKPTRSKKMGIA
jgi:hypothetical protein